MKKILFAISLLICSISYGQNVRVGSPLTPIKSDSSFSNYSTGYSGNQIGQAYVKTPTLTDIFYGDSWTQGGPLNYGVGVRFTSLIATADNALEWNRGIGGTDMHFVSPGDSSMPDRIYTIPVYNSSVFHLLFIQYGTNDAIQGIDSAVFRTWYNKVLDSAIIARGWPPQNIVLLGNGYFIRVGSDTVKIRAVTPLIAASKGVNYVDMYHAMVVHQPWQNVLIIGDTVHPNVYGNKVIYQTVVDTMVRRIGIQLSANQVIYGNNLISGNETISNVLTDSGSVSFLGDSNVINTKNPGSNSLTINAPYVTLGSYNQIMFRANVGNYPIDSFALRRTIGGGYVGSFSIRHNTSDIYKIDNNNNCSYNGITNTFNYGAQFGANVNIYQNAPDYNTYTLQLHGVGFQSHGVPQYHGLYMDGVGSSDIFYIKYNIQSGFHNDVTFGNANGNVFTIGASNGTYPLVFNQSGVQLAASTTTVASLNIPSGTAPTSPVSGDVYNAGTYFNFFGPDIRLYHDATHFGSFIVNSSGNVTITPSGTLMTLADAVTITGATTLQGALTVPTVSTATDYSIGSSDVIVFCTAATFTITLPTASSNTGRILYIKHTVNSGNITLSGGGGMCSGEFNLMAPQGTTGASVTLTSDGTCWRVLSMGQ